MNNYLEYKQCGEILIPPSLNYKDRYILKCVECNEYYTELESLILHCLSHYECKEKSEEKSVLETWNDTFENDEKVDEEHLIIKKEDSDDEEQLSCIDNEETKAPEAEANPIYTDDDISESEFYKEDECLMDYPQSDDEYSESEDSNTTIFVRNFLGTEKNVTTLIAAYKNCPYLWNSNLQANIRVRERPKCLQQIATELKELLDLQITSSQVAAIITRMRHDYREQLKRLKSKKSKSSIENTWFSELLCFLKPFMENNSIAILDSLQPELVPKQIIKILSIYERFPVLWNTDLIENVCTNKRSEAIVDMQKVVESEMGLKANITTLKRYTHCIHIHFTREKRRKITNVVLSDGSSEIYEHMFFLWDHVGPFKCSECNKVFLSPLNAKVHKAEHDGSIPLKCSLCKKEYKRTDAYMAHARRHMNDLKNECKDCGKKFSRPADLKIHRRCHTGAKPYCCEICGASYRHSQAFTTHKRRHEKLYLHHCHICSKGFYKKDQMDNHIRTHTNIRDFICKICNKGFKTKKTLQQHEFTHEEGRNHACLLCGKTFKNKIGVSQHMKTHRRIEKNESELNSFNILNMQ